METVVRIPILETERLRLRAPEARDFDAYYAFRSGPRSKFVGGPNTRAQSFAHMANTVGQWHLRGYGRWIVADKETDAPLGLVGIYHPDDWPEPELAWSMFEGSEGKGYAYEAAFEARRYAYDVFGLPPIISCIDPKNDRSKALGQRLGAVPGGTFTHHELGTMHMWRHPAREAL